MLHSCSTANIWLHLPLRKFADYKSFILEDNNFFLWSMVLDPPFVWRLHSAYTGHVTAHNLVHLITSRILNGIISTWRLRIHRIWTTTSMITGHHRAGTPWIRSLWRDDAHRGLSRFTPMRPWRKTKHRIGAKPWRRSYGPRTTPESCMLARWSGLPKQEKIRRRPEKG